MNKRLLLISADALMYEDLKYASTLPNFRYLMENGSRVERLRSVDPTLTYPCHVTMLTGCRPSRHGVWNNEQQRPGDAHPPWNWYHDVVRCPDLMDVCKAAGYSTAAVGWPVTGNHPSVDYLVDEIWPFPVIEDEEKAVPVLRERFLHSGTTQEVLSTCVENWMHMRVRRRQPDTAWFSTIVCSNILRRYRPEVTVLHIATIDTFRHEHGVFGEHIERALIETDKMLGMLFDALRETGDFDRTGIVLTADHGQIDIDRKVKPNVLFREAGLIRTDAGGNVAAWDAWCHYAGSSAQVILKDPDDPILRAEVEALLRDIIAAGDSGIGSIRTVEETEKTEQLSGSFSFVLGTDGHTGFSSEWRGDYLCPIENAPVGSHGFHPDLGPCPPLICCGPDFRTGVVLPKANLYDGAPTWASILGVSLPASEGRVLQKILL